MPPLHITPEKILLISNILHELKRHNPKRLKILYENILEGGIIIKNRVTDIDAVDREYKESLETAFEKHYTKKQLISLLVRIIT